MAGMIEAAVPPWDWRARWAPHTAQAWIEHGAYQSPPLPFFAMLMAESEQLIAVSETAHRGMTVAASVLTDNYRKEKQR